MKRSARTLGLQACSIVLGLLPFAFASIRAVTTHGQDLRYFWIALATVAGAAAAVAAARLATRKRIAVLSGAVFVSATLFAIVAALWVGTTLGPGLLVVASAFGICAAGSYLLGVVEAPN